MTKAEKIFNMIVTIIVVLTGAGFGAWTGVIYSYSESHYWWIGMVAGLVSAYPLAKLYLRRLAKTSGKTKTWFYGTFSAVLCGIGCTSFVHGAMLLFKYTGSAEVLYIILIIGEIIGAVAGFLVGGVCSLVYVFAIKGRQSETA